MQTKATKTDKTEQPHKELFMPMKVNWVSFLPYLFLNGASGKFKTAEERSEFLTNLSNMGEDLDSYYEQKALARRILKSGYRTPMVQRIGSQATKLYKLEERLHKTLKEVAQERSKYLSLPPEDLDYYKALQPQVLYDLLDSQDLDAAIITCIAFLHNNVSNYLNDLEKDEWERMAKTISKKAH